MSNSIVEALYESGSFRPLAPVDLPDRTRVRLVVEVDHLDHGQQRPIKSQLDEIQRLAEEAFGNMAPEEESAMQVARLEQRHFFRRPRR